MPRAPIGKDGLIRDAAKARGWSARQGHVVRVEQGIVSKAFEFAGWFRFYALPAVWNETLWQLLNLFPDRAPPITRHATTMSLPTPLLWSEPDNSKDVESHAVALIDFAEKARLATQNWSLSDLRAQQEHAVENLRPFDFTITEVIWHIVEGRWADARKVCEDVRRGDRRAGVSVYGENMISLFDVVLNRPEGFTG